MTRQISINTRMGWISAFENEGKIFRIKFGKLKKQTRSDILVKFKINLTKFFKKKNKKTFNSPRNARGESSKKNLERIKKN